MAILLLKKTCVFLTDIIEFHPRAFEIYYGFLTKNFMMEKSSYGPAVRWLRGIRGQTQKDLANALGIPSVKLCRVEKGRHLTPDVLVKICEVFGMSRADFDELADGLLSRMKWIQLPCNSTEIGDQNRADLRALISSAKILEYTRNALGFDARKVNTRGAPVELAMSIRSQWHLGTSTPIPEISSVLGINGILLSVMSVERAACGLVGELPFIIVKRGSSPFVLRQQAAEMLGLLITRNRRQAKGSMPLGEKERRRFAGYLLIPNALIQQFVLSAKYLEDAEFFHRCVQHVSEYAGAPIDMADFRLREWVHEIRDRTLTFAATEESVSVSSPKPLWNQHLESITSFRTHSKRER